MASDFLMEEREDHMLSPAAGAASCPRIAHFLNPSVTSMDGPVSAPSLDPPASKPKGLPLKVKFAGWRRPQNKWNSWVEQMRPLHRSAWKSAGIFDAIANTTYTIHRHDDLIFGFLDRWCPATNTFVLPWGEATVTLEDVRVIGGYSVLGASVLTLPADAEFKAIEKKLLAARSHISKTKSKKADQGVWTTKFMGSQSEIEHEAFLAYWLSRFVFPFHFNVIGRKVLPIAVALARGTKIALAPAVLACIYKSLSLLKTAATALRKSGQKDVLEVTVPAPLQLVQAWIWERFPTLSPNPNSIESIEPRLARWDQLKKFGIRDFSKMIDSAAKDFIWRPYVMDLGSSANACPRMIYMDSEYWALVEPELDDELEGLIRCLRSSELVGLDADCVEQKLPYRLASIEQYLPHRVARQFGMDQDIPGHVARVNVNAEVAWSDYTRPVRDTKLYVPPRFSKPECTTRYLEWWEKLRQGWCSAPDVNGPNASPKVEQMDLVGIKLEDKELSPPPGFSPKRRSSVEAGNSGIPKQFQEKIAPRLKRKYVETSLTKITDFYVSPTRRQSSPPPGFSPKRRSSVEAGDSGIPKQSQERIAPTALSRLKRKYVETSLTKITNFYVSPTRRQSKESESGIERKGVRAELFSENDGDKGKDDLSSTADNGNIEGNMAESPESGTRGKDATEASEGCMDESDTKNSPVQSSTSEAPGTVVELEERIKKLEEHWAWLKEGKLFCQ